MYSENKIKCMYFNNRFKEKPQGKQCGWVQKSLTETDITIEELADALCHGASFKPGVLQGGMKADNWVQQQLFGLHCIQRKGYCTEKEVVYILGNEYRYEVTETQIKRCLNEIMDCYGLKKVKANKVLKEQFDIKSDGYPNIIIEDEM